MTTTFETAKVGDRVWSIIKGWGKISRIDEYGIYPITVSYDSDGGYDTFTFGGYKYKTDSMRTIFWDEVKLKTPPKPLPKLEVDAKVLVWDSNKQNVVKRYFSHFNAHGMVCVFAGGSTSWSGNGNTLYYRHWELAE